MEKVLITSSDGELQIINYKIITGLFGEMAVDGTVKNIGLKSNVTAVIKVDYFDSNGDYIDSSTDMVKRLEPGKAGAFEVTYSGLTRYRIKDLKLSVSNL
jgi:hypothetical protein